LNYPRAEGLEWNAVAVDPADAKHILGANNWAGAVFESRDGGGTWQWSDMPPLEMQGIRVIAFAPADPDVVYAGSGAYFSAGGFDNRMPASGIFKSLDGGKTWSGANDGSTGELQITGLAVQPNDENTVFATSPENGLFQTDDGGQSWTRMEGLPAQARPLSVAIDPGQPETLSLTGWWGIMDADFRRLAAGVLYHQHPFRSNPT
jgi:photosystem II stability/assembly factor-like uncharacterized protein